MPIHKDDFLKFAKNLPEDSEINNRNAISRAYYAAYHSCSEKFTSEKSTPGGVHATLISSLEKSPNSQDRKIGYLLRDIKNKRTIADYQLAEAVTLADRQTTLKTTAKLIGLIGA
jgi:uncharacterized protein (UPF0332 family)